MSRSGLIGLLLGAGLFVACGQTEKDERLEQTPDAAAGAAGVGATGGGGAGAGGSGATGGGAGSVAVGGSAGLPGSGGSSGSAGVAGAAGECATLAYCDCRDRSDCKVEAETCFCPCGVEPCEPNCDCACGGGKYLGCSPTSIDSPGAVLGIWLIGWSGGLNHYSWVRLDADGSAHFFDGANIVANAPRWCTGSGNWILTAKPSTIGLYPPPACADFEALTFESFGPPSSYAKGSILSATLSTGVQPSYLEGYKYAASQCDAAMTSCADPFL